MAQLRIRNLEIPADLPDLGADGHRSGAVRLGGTLRIPISALRALPLVEVEDR